MYWLGPTLSLLGWYCWRRYGSCHCYGSQVIKSPPSSSCDQIKFLCRCIYLHLHCHLLIYYFLHYIYICHYIILWNIQLTPGLPVHPDALDVTLPLPRHRHRRHVRHRSGSLCLLRCSAFIMNITVAYDGDSFSVNVDFRSKIIWFHFHGPFRQASFFNDKTTSHTQCRNNDKDKMEPKVMFLSLPSQSQDQTCIREGVKKKRIYSGLCPKHRTPPTHRARLGLH